MHTPEHYQSDMLFFFDGRPEALSLYQALAAQIAQLERENEALSEDLANAGDPSLIEKIAREELGMVMPNEKVFYTYGG